MVDIAELHTVNVDVDDINIQKLAELPGEERSYQQTTTGSENLCRESTKVSLAQKTVIVGRVLVMV